MNDAEIRALFPTHITRGALLRADNTAVGLVVGGAPSWDLMSLDGRSRVGGDYHRLLLALDTALDVFVVDQPPDLAREIGELQARQERASQPLLADTLQDMADYLAELGQSTGSQAKQVVWAVTIGGGAGAATRTAGSLDLAALLRGRKTAQQSGPAPAGRAALAQAVERARRLVDAIRTFGSSPAPRLMEAEEIARLIYQLADPVRAARYPLAGTLLDRVRRVVTVPDPVVG